MINVHLVLEDDLHMQIHLHLSYRFQLRIFLTNALDLLIGCKVPAPATHPPGHAIPSSRYPFSLPAFASSTLFYSSLILQQLEL